MCEDYRATFGIDLEMDTEDFEAGRRVECPALVLWGGPAASAATTSPRRSGRSMPATIVRMHAVASGHYLSEEAPEETAAELKAFFKEARS